MKFAIPLFGERVAPNFWSAQEILIVLTEGLRVCTTWRRNLARLSRSEKKQLLLSLGIDTLICGGIDQTTRGVLEKRGIRVFADTVGEAMEALVQFLKMQPQLEGAT